jgi:hypothetical protein
MRLSTSHYGNVLLFGLNHVHNTSTLLSMLEVWLQTVTATCLNCYVDGLIFTCYSGILFSFQPSVFRSRRAVLGGGSFKLESSIAAEVLQVGQAMFQWLKESTMLLWQKRLQDLVSTNSRMALQ